MMDVDTFFNMTVEYLRHRIPVSKRGSDEGEAETFEYIEYK